MKKFTIFSAVFALVAMLLLTPAHAQTTSTTTSTTSFCFPIDQDLGYGARDTNGNGLVSWLQGFLHTRGYLSVNPTGWFGPSTRAAVRAYQRDNGITATGYFGPLSRGYFHSHCDGGTTVPPVNQPVSISSINPSTGPIGTLITLKGSGFTSDSLIHFGTGGINKINYIDSNTISFTLPDGIGPFCKPGQICALYLMLINPGNYPVSVENNNGISNSVTFTVTDGSSSNGTLSINGIDAPSTLPISTSGTWTVHATTSINNSTLHYSVVWGDESASPMSIAAPSNTTVQNSTTFTHSYQRTGTYYPTFTVTDNSGHTATVSSTIVVTPWY